MFTFSYFGYNEYHKQNHKHHVSGAARGHSKFLLPTGSEERGVLGVRRIPVAIIPCSQDTKTVAL